MAEIIGNDRPIAIPPPPPPKYSDIELMAVAAVSITIQVGATVGLSALGVPAPVSYGIGAGLSNLAGQATSWGLGMQAPGQDGIDWSGVGVAAMEGAIFSMAGRFGMLGREVWQQAKGGFDGWTSGPGLNWTGIGGSLFNVGFDALGPVLGGPRVGQFNFGVAGLVNSAYNPRSGWAIPGRGRSPVVGAFEYAYSAVANGLANMAYNWIRDQLERPSVPVRASGPRSVDDPRGPLPAELLELWDDIDRLHIEQLDSAALFARNQEIASAGADSVDWQLRMAQLLDRIDHFGEGIDDRAIVASVLKQKNAERLHRAQAAAAARARAALRTARLRANSARIEAQMAAARPDPNLAQFVRDMEETENLFVKDMYGSGNFVHVSDNVEIDGLKIERGRGIYDTQGLYPDSRSSRLLDAEVLRYREFLRQQPASELPMVGLEVIALESMNTPAAQARRLGLAHVQTFEQFNKAYARRPGGDSVEKAFLDYHFRRSREINANWDRIDNAAGAVNLIAAGTLFGVGFMLDPAGTIATSDRGAGHREGSEGGRGRRADRRHDRRTCQRCHGRLRRLPADGQGLGPGRAARAARDAGRVRRCPAGRPGRRVRDEQGRAHRRGRDPVQGRPFGGAGGAAGRPRLVAGRHAVRPVARPGARWRHAVRAAASCARRGRADVRRRAGRRRPRFLPAGRHPFGGAL